MNDGERGVGGMIISRGNRSTRRKPAAVPLCPPQVLHDLTWDRTRAAAVGSRRLTAWTSARPPFGLLCDAVRIPDYTASNDRVNDCKGLGRKRPWPNKGTTLAFVWREWEGGGRTQTSSVRIPVSRPRLEPSTTRTDVQNLTATLTS
jgi:hypothetical protein